MAVTVLFSRSRRIGSRLIRWLTWSDWSHCAVYDPVSKTVIESTWPGGVKETPLLEFVERAEAWAFREFDEWDAPMVLARARQQIGKRYDLGALLGFLGNRDWQRTDRWFCSELVGWAAVDFLPYHAGLVYRLTPQHLWALKGGCYVQP